MPSFLLAGMRQSQPAHLARAFGSTRAEPVADCQALAKASGTHYLDPVPQCHPATLHRDSWRLLMLVRMDKRTG